MQIHNGCKKVVLVGSYERFFQIKLFGGTSGTGRILSLYERNRPIIRIPYKKKKKMREKKINKKLKLDNILNKEQK